MIRRDTICFALFSLVVLCWATQALAGDKASGLRDIGSYEWTEVNPDADWAPRASVRFAAGGGDALRLISRAARQADQLRL